MSRAFVFYRKRLKMSIFADISYLIKQGHAETYTSYSVIS